MIDSILERRIRKNKLAHGYLLIGDVDYEKLEAFLRGIGGEIYSYTDGIHINTIREMKEKVYSGTLQGHVRKFFILFADRMGYYTMSALLKILEDPPQNRYFFLVASTATVVPDTVRSRLVEVFLGFSPESSHSIESFLSADIAQRNVVTEDIAQEQERFNVFLNALEGWARKKQDLALLLRIQNVRTQSRTLNVGRKMCLEYLTTFLAKD